MTCVVHSPCWRRSVQLLVPQQQHLEWQHPGRPVVPSAAHFPGPERQPAERLVAHRPVSLHLATVSGTHVAVCRCLEVSLSRCLCLRLRTCMCVCNTRRMHGASAVQGAICKQQLALRVHSVVNQLMQQAAVRTGQSSRLVPSVLDGCGIRCGSSLTPFSRCFSPHS